MRDSFVLYTKIKETVEKLTEEQKGILLQAILDYETDKAVEINDPVVEIAFIPIRQDLDFTNAKWDETKKARSEAGKRSAEAKKQNATKPNNVEQSPTKSTVNENVYVYENVYVKESKRFAPPSVDEVKEYCRERNNNVDAGSFVDFYTSKGWKVGGQAMKDWKAAVRTWERRDKGKAPPAKGHFENEREYDFDAIEQQFVKGAK